MPRSRPDPANRLDALRKRNEPPFAERDRKIRRLRASGISLAAIGALRHFCRSRLPDMQGSPAMTVHHLRLVERGAPSVEATDRWFPSRPLPGDRTIDLALTPNGRLIERPQPLPARLALPAVVALSLGAWAAIWFALDWMVRALL
jgi:hypothetical protein